MSTAKSRRCDSVGGFGNLLMFGQGGFLDHADTVANITLFPRR